MATRRIDGKYAIKAFDSNGEENDTVKIEIVNTISGQAIPEDEPLFIFRARDRLALDQLKDYYSACINDGCSQGQLDGISNMITEFVDWQVKNQDKMKQPGSSMHTTK